MTCFNVIATYVRVFGPLPALIMRSPSSPARDIGVWPQEVVFSVAKERECACRSQSGTNS